MNERTTYTLANILAMYLPVYPSNGAHFLITAKQGLIAHCKHSLETGAPSWVSCTREFSASYFGSLQLTSEKRQKPNKTAVRTRLPGQTAASDPREGPKDCSAGLGSSPAPTS